MKIAYLVFAYRNPRLLRREIQALSSPDTAFFIHIDQKSNLLDFSLIQGDNVFFLTDRVKVYWAEFSGVRAILKLISHALTMQVNYDYFVLLSGSEFPLRSRQYIHEFLEHHRGSEFIDLVRIPSAVAGKPLAHINTYRPQTHQPIKRLMSRALARFGGAQRDYRQHLGSLQPYAGHTWWTLSRGACTYIMDFIKKNPSYVSFFENVPQPEEIFFHTIVGNSPFQACVRRSLLYEDWSAAGAHPAMISESHLAFFESQREICLTDVWGTGEVLFARKFSDERLDLLDRLETMIAKKEDKLFVGNIDGKSGQTEC